MTLKIIGQVPQAHHLGVVHVRWRSGFAAAGSAGTFSAGSLHLTPSRRAFVDSSSRAAGAAHSSQNDNLSSTTKIFRLRLQRMQGGLPLIGTGNSRVSDMRLLVCFIYNADIATSD